MTLEIALVLAILVVARRGGVAASQVLMPLAYGTPLGLPLTLLVLALAMLLPLGWPL